MLTADLVEARIVRGKIEPAYAGSANEAALEAAATLIALFQDGVGRTRGDLESELKQLGGVRKEYLLQRGLAKLLLDRCEFAANLPKDLEASDVRRMVFEHAAGQWLAAGPRGIDADAVRAEIAVRLGVAGAELPRLLYADLKEEQVIVKFAPLSPRELIERYDLALCQAVLLRATRLEVALPPQSAAVYRAIFRAIKFHQLLFEVCGDASAGYTIALDGPLSLFTSAAKYGVSLANFVPHLLHCEGFRASATVIWGHSRTQRKFEFSHENGFLDDRRLLAAYVPDEMSWFVDQFEKLGSEWNVSDQSEIVDLGGRGVFVADYVFTHRGTGLIVRFEVLGYWRRSALESRLRLLREFGTADLLLGVGRELHAAREDLAGLPGEVYVFRSVPIAREVRDRLDARLEAIR